MSHIVDFLKSEREKYIPLITHFMATQKQQYSSLTREYAELLNHLEDYLIRGGKWHRPATGLVAYQIAGGDSTNEARQALIALEIMHRFLLIHDDIIDQDFYRHDGPTLEKVYKDRFAKLYPTQLEGMYSKAHAIVAGDIVKTMAFNLIVESDFSDKIKTAAVRGITQMMMETGAGWQLQMEQNYQLVETVSEEDFFTGMQLVSAQYSIVWPLRMGQIFAGKLTADEWDKNLETYGWHTGAAFQIMDDILGMFGEPEETGKPVGHDYREGKKTFLVLYAYDKATEADKAFIQNTLGKEIDAETLRRIQTIMKETGALEKVKTKALTHAAKAKEALIHVKSANPQALVLLEELADLLANRSH